MAKKSNWWYVLVLTNYGAVFVTGIPGHNTAQWEKNKKPREFSKEYAQQMAIGLCANGYLAFAVCQPFELKSQPYRYDLGEFRFERTGNGMSDVVSWIAGHKVVYEDFKNRFPQLIEDIEEEQEEE